MKVPNKKIITFFIVCVIFAGIFIWNASIPDKYEISYPTIIPRECPVFPSPINWFKWKQRYVYSIFGTDKKSFMDGYGEYHPPLKASDGKVYGNNMWLSSITPEKTESNMWIRIKEYKTEFKGHPDGLTWYMKGQKSLILSGEIGFFDYPLVLGKTWKSNSKIMRIIPISVEGTVVAFIPDTVKTEKDVIVARGYTYTLPVEVKHIPQPLAPIYEKKKSKEWDVLLDAVGRKDTHSTWSEIFVPAGPMAGTNVRGYYAVRTTTYIMGIKVFESETWKDVRGCVALLEITSHPPLSIGTKHLIKIAQAWSGNSE